MGVVLAARHIQLDDRVAIKLLLPEMLAEEGVLERFLQEARAARKIKSEHVAAVTDVGLLESGTPYIIMEYLEGRDLAKVRSERSTLEVEEVVDYVLQACEAIAEAHSHGIIHRDLKPANLFLTRRPDGAPLVKVLDFGTSKMCPKEASPDFEMTKTGMAIGSPSYMAPEQMLSSRNLDARADIWALGVILYNLLTGTFPFKAETLLQMCAAVIQLPPTPPTKHRPSLPSGLEAVILKCLEKKPEDRFDDVAVLARALLPFAPRDARLSVERIERVLGVTSDLATFLAPSERTPRIPHADVERLEVQIPAALLPSPFSSRPGTRPEAAVITKSLTTSSLATVVRSDTDAAPFEATAAQPVVKRGRKMLAVATTGALALVLGLFVVVPRVSPPSISMAAASGVASPAPAGAQEPQGATTAPTGVMPADAIDPGTPNPPSQPAPTPVAMAEQTAAPDSQAPLPPSTGAVAPDRTASGARPGARGAPLAQAAAPDAQKKTDSATSTPNPPAAPVPAPAPIKKAEPSVVIPDDR